MAENVMASDERLARVRFSMPESVCQLAAGLLTSVVFIGSLLGAGSTALASSFNIDFSYPGGSLPSSVFGAASGQIGVWNAFDNPPEFGGIPPFGLVDLNGAASGSSISFTAPNSFTQNPLGVVGDPAYLVEDFFYTFVDGVPYSVLLTGLQNGVYDVYLYAPNHSLIGTGSGTVNGIGFANAIGLLTSPTLIFGTHYSVATGVTVSDGTLLVASNVNDTNYGLSGMQLVSADVPEPGPLFLLGIGLAAMAARRWRRPVHIG